MNAKIAKKLRRQARDCFAVRDEADRKPRDSYVIAGKGKREYETREMNEDGTPKKMALTVYTFKHHPDSLRGLYRAFKRMAREERQ